MKLFIFFVYVHVEDEIALFAAWVSRFMYVHNIQIDEDRWKVLPVEFAETI